MNHCIFNASSIANYVLINAGHLKSSETNIVCKCQLSWALLPRFPPLLHLTNLESSNIDDISIKAAHQPQCPWSQDNGDNVMVAVVIIRTSAIPDFGDSWLRRDVLREFLDERSTEWANYWMSEVLNERGFFCTNIWWARYFFRRMRSWARVFSTRV